MSQRLVAIDGRKSSRSSSGSSLFLQRSLFLSLSLSLPQGAGTLRRGWYLPLGLLTQHLPYTSVVLAKAAPLYV